MFRLNVGLRNQNRQKPPAKWDHKTWRRLIDNERKSMIRRFVGFERFMGGGAETHSNDHCSLAMGKPLRYFSLGFHFVAQHKRYLNALFV